MSADGHREQLPLTVRVRELITHPHQVVEIIRYGGVGAFISVLYLAIYSGLIAAGIHYLVAAAIGFLISATVGYWLHEHFSFLRGRPTWTGLLKWYLAQSGASILDLVLLAVLVDHFHVEKILAQLVLLPFIPVISYVLGRYWIFTRASPLADTTENGESST